LRRLRRRSYMIPLQQNSSVRPPRNYFGTDMRRLRATLALALLWGLVWAPYEHAQGATGGGPMPEWYVGPTSRSIDASSVMWLFFREHPLRGGARPTTNDNYHDSKRISRKPTDQVG
jgi:hypothetical protein